MIILDASVAVKWFVEEANSDLARQLLRNEQGHLHVPDIFVVEVSSTLVREANRNKAETAYFRSGLNHLTDMIDRQALLLEQTSAGFVADAACLAVALGHPLKDCIYLKLAMDRACPLVTADAKFAAKARGVWDRVRVLGEGDK